MVKVSMWECEACGESHRSEERAIKCEESHIEKYQDGEIIKTGDLIRVRKNSPLVFVIQNNTQIDEYTPDQYVGNMLGLFDWEYKDLNIYPIKTGKCTRKATERELDRTISDIKVKLYNVIKELEKNRPQTVSESDDRKIDVEKDEL